MVPHIFREYDIRGLVDVDLTDEVASKVGLGLGTTLRRRGLRRLVVGRDCRVSSTRFRDVLVPALESTGCDVVDLGVVPTPLTYFAANTLPVDGLAMITGSHNPADYNGFKVGVGKTTFFGDEIQDLRRLIASGDFEKGSGTTRGWDVVGPYCDFVRQDIRHGQRRLKLVIDAGNGVGGQVAVPLFRSMGFEVVPLFCELDGRFPNHHPDPTILKNMKDLSDRVLAEKADLGIAYDGDADRIGAVDEEGRVMWGDELTLLFARELLRIEPGAAVVGEVKCSMRMFDGIAKAGGRPIMWKAGHSLIKAKMKEEGALLGGEMSGHIFWKHRYFGFDDAIYSTARLLEILSATDRKLSQLLADVPKTFATEELRVQTVEEKKFEIVRRAVAHFKAAGHQVVDVDGVRVVFPDGWGLIRSSNTQPILVLRFEATTEERLVEIRALVEGALAKIQRSV
ncbi:MAG TPA: phosphomannomutase/phosphoglucomutase [Myxococcales bacterium]|jgi:phosphomannomutase/phosphoglucomutase